MSNPQKTKDDLVQALDQFKKDLLLAPFGSLAKSETQYLIFRLLVDSAELDDCQDDFVLANQLGITAARVRGLRFRLDQARVSRDTLALDQVLSKGGFIIGAADKPESIRLEFTRSYVREHFLSVLREKRVVVDRTLSANVIELPIFKFFDLVFAELIGDKKAREASADAKAAADLLLSELNVIKSAAERNRKRSAAKKVMGAVLPNLATGALQRFTDFLIAAGGIPGH